jgi:hypothetical protein
MYDPLELACGRWSIREVRCLQTLVASLTLEGALYHVLRGMSSGMFDGADTYDDVIVIAGDWPGEMVEVALDE